MQNLGINSSQQFEEKHYNNIFMQKYYNLMQSASVKHISSNLSQPCFNSGSVTVRQSTQNTINLSKASQQQLQSS